MAIESTKKEEIEKILRANENLLERAKGEDWNIYYNKKADMITMGANFPAGTFYYCVDDGAMIRIDENNKIYGFAIENAKFYLKRHPEIALLFYPIVHPYRFFGLLLRYKFVRNVDKIGKILSFSNSIAGKAHYGLSNS
ncbi:MAG: hypothetical protein A2951_03000 [Candidatus Buchananbacteria bacterium RIFCSPLOWO2_01_FULL_56_15]|uniref:Uncharacterized protein n=1 Tax=Candidatus Buchananbacteria bacterium RIFCSPLOWO2_01_FULL_56_15 TaxID=1797547 RepID=A0A1G1YQI3_9BACT|nr:MAG: hypothetical protein A2951_03000 [Candidatus Buchananbacteria bacterium RIFCSPLOWO2_01_FULL_56_15]